MANNSYYWEGKNERARNAAHRTSLLNERFGKEIQHSVDNTRRYDGPLSTQDGTGDKTDIFMKIYEGDSVAALMSLCKPGQKTAVLNFASYKHAGGGYLAGSRAQEESLCHESFLYNVLSKFEDSYYVPNRKDLNRALYRDKALYSQDVMFNRNGKKRTCDVLTCASPNFSAAEKSGVTREQNNVVMRERIRIILEIAKREKVNTFIVGAWGCGVFGQDPNVVAKLFAEESRKVLQNTSMEIVFAVIPPLPHQTDNLTPFVEMVKDFRANRI